MNIKGGMESKRGEREREKRRHECDLIPPFPNTTILLLLLDRILKQTQTHKHTSHKHAHLFCYNISVKMMMIFIIVQKGEDDFFFWISKAPFSVLIFSVSSSFSPSLFFSFFFSYNLLGRDMRRFRQNET